MGRRIRTDRNLGAELVALRWSSEKQVNSPGGSSAHSKLLIASLGGGHEPTYTDELQAVYQIPNGQIPVCAALDCLL